MKRVLILIFLVMQIIVVSAHSGKAKYHLIIDTDGGADDMRAITMFLASYEFEILGFTCSDGVLSPHQTAIKLNSLLKYLHHEGIQIGEGTIYLNKEPEFRKTAEQINWSDHVLLEKLFPNNSEILKNIIENEDEKIIFVNLGSLNTINSFLKLYPDKIQKIERLVWYGSHADFTQNLNYNFDPKSAKEILRSDLKTDIVGNSNNLTINANHLEINKDLLFEAKYLNSINTNVDQLNWRGHIHDRTFMAWDDLLPIFLVKPELFSTNIIKKHQNTKYYYPVKDSIITETYREILFSKNYIKGKVMDGFPIGSELYRSDVAQIKESAIKKHGLEEWRIGVLTNEMHGHLGIYAIIGAKMGLRAREYFNIGIDDIHITSYAGSKPPLSCMNDGLQMSTGATLGHGLIQISEDQIKKSEAEFQFKNHKIKLTLKEEYLKLIQQDIITAIEKYGLGTEEYWEQIRNNALQYWLDWNRFEIFEITELN